MKNLTLPQTIDCERVLLGRMLSSINAVNDAMISLEASDFFDPIHQRIFSAMKTLYGKEQSIEPVSVSAEMELTSPGSSDIVYLVGLTEHTYSEEVKTFIEQIKNCSLKRKLIGLGFDQINSSQDLSKDPFEIYAETARKLDEIFFTHDNKKEIEIFENLHGNYLDSNCNWFDWVKKRYVERMNGTLKMTGIPTGYDLLDRTLNGLNASHYIILAGRPGDGKSTFAMNIMYNMMQKGIKIGFFSLEMTTDQVANQIGCLAAQLDKGKVERGEISLDEFEIIKSWENSNVFRNMIIDDQDGLKISQIRARTKRMIKNHGIRVLFIDYLGKIAPDTKYSNRQEAIQSVSINLAQLAKETKLPIFCLAQLNRNSETQNRAPQKSDLRESGQIEADAHAILLLHRKDAEDKFNHPGVTQVRIVKNRFGAEENIDYYFLKQFGKFQEALTGKIKEEIQAVNEY